MPMRHVFGPVRSRRLGRSLGVDPIPFKTCNWNCVYCQLGRTAPFALERGEYAPAEEIVEEVREAARRLGPAAIDWITFAGSGEPTLHSRLGWMIDRIRAETGLPVAVLTNGSLLHRADVAAELLGADAVLPTLDAGSEKVYRRIDRPPAELDFDRYVGGLVEFAAAYGGSLQVEVMLVGGINDTDEALDDLAAVLARLEPDEVHLNRPTRPPADPWVRPPGDDVYARAARRLGAVARVVGPPPVDDGELVEGDLADAIASVVRRHPVADDDLPGAFPGRSPEEIDRAVATAAADGRIGPVERHGRRFWAAGEARFASDRRHDS